MKITYKYKKGTVKDYPHTLIYFKGERVGYYMPLYNKPVYRYGVKGNNDRWYVNINTDDYFLIEKAASKEEIIKLVEKCSKEGLCLN